MRVLLAFSALVALAVIAIVIRLTRTTRPDSRAEPLASEGRKTTSAAVQPEPPAMGASDEDVTEFTLAVTGDRPFLLVTTGPGAGTKHFLSATGTTTIGRSRGSDIVVEASAASATHCKVVQKGATYVLTDLGSTNQTWVNGVAVEQAVLRNGDQIQIGDATMSFALFGNRT